jgi:hypothetical protein
MLAKARSGANGITAQIASAGISDRNGASRNRNLFASAGITISLNSSLTTSANGWPRPGTQNRLTRFGPRALHPADDLALGERVERHGQDEADHDHEDLHGVSSGDAQYSRDHAGQPIPQRTPLPHVRARRGQPARPWSSPSARSRAPAHRPDTAADPPRRRRPPARRARREPARAPSVAPGSASPHRAFSASRTSSAARVVEARQVQQIREHSQHLPARPALARRLRGALSSSANGPRR